MAAKLSVALCGLFNMFSAFISITWLSDYSVGQPNIFARCQKLVA